MTKQEYEDKKQAIIKEHGTPEKDWDQTPLNESARLTKVLTASYMNYCRQQKLKEKQELVKGMPTNTLAPNTLKALASQITPQERKRYSDVPLEAIYLEEKDSKPFSKLEWDLLKCWYETGRSLSHQQLADKFDINRSKVTALMNSVPARLLDAKLFDLIMPQVERIALQQAVRAGDSKITLRMAEHHKVINPEQTQVNITSKPIEDPEALKMLKELGDRLA